eukprot:TRINITY_DN27116_c0_g1_i1.p1 TRINITY_DN27116_c0_g1~~TRINITY_DN27116_c0_g1_i1.p1  ORF type:complete len:435 (+),score=117.98 TRINITY_DN27116_c0_g1_i1:60-1307(+)
MSVAACTHEPGGLGPLRAREVVKAAAPTVAEALARVEDGAEELSLHSVKLDTQAAMLLGRCLRRSRLVRLLLPNCDARDAGAECIGAALCDPACCLEHVDISTNCVTMLSPRFVDGVARCATLVGLNVGQNPLKRSSVAALCAAVGRDGCHVAHLDLTSAGGWYNPTELAAAARRVAVLRCGSNSCWSQPEAAAFVAALEPQDSGSKDAPVPRAGKACLASAPVFTLLTALDLTSSCLGSGDVPFVNEVLRVAPRLEQLCLRHNDIDADGLVALCSGLQDAAHLVGLNLSSNPLAGIRLPRAGQYTEKGLLALATTIETVRSLQYVDVSRCCLGLGNNPFYDGEDHGGVGYLVDAVKRNVYMKHLLIANNNFNAATVRRLRTVARGKGVFDSDRETDTAVVFCPASSLNYAAYAP